jgi:hypothetical protein
MTFKSSWERTQVCLSSFYRGSSRSSRGARRHPSIRTLLLKHFSLGQVGVLDRAGAANLIVDLSSDRLGRDLVAVVSQVPIRFAA